jgi:hypothetical protein
MSQRFERVAAMPRVERERAVAELLDYESGLPEADLRTIIVAEMRSLIALPQDDAAEVQRAIDAFVKARPAAFSMRRMAALQRACRDLSLDEVSKLESLVPDIRAHAGLAPARLNGSMPAQTPGSDSIRPRRSVVSRLFSRP